MKGPGDPSLCQGFLCHFLVRIKGGFKGKVADIGSVVKLDEGLHRHSAAEALSKDSDGLVGALGFDVFDGFQAGHNGCLGVEGAGAAAVAGVIKNENVVAFIKQPIARHDVG